MHIDETDDPHSRFTEVLAAETIKRGLNGRVTASHTTSMHSVDNAYAFKLIRLIKRAGLHMVTNPCDNSVLQGRFDTYPKRRGHTRVKELLAAGINVGIGHDSIMDPWYPLGVGDPVQVAFVWIHYGQMSGASEIPQVWDMITTNPAKTFGATDKTYGLIVGNPADLVLLDAGDRIRRPPPHRPTPPGNAQRSNRRPHHPQRNGPLPEGLEEGSDRFQGARMKVRDVLRLLRDDGWYLARQRGSHQQYKHPTKRGLVTVAGKPNDDLAPGTLNSILKQAELK